MSKKTSPKTELPENTSQENPLTQEMVNQFLKPLTDKVETLTAKLEHLVITVLTPKERTTPAPSEEIQAQTIEVLNVIQRNPNSQRDLILKLSEVPTPHWNLIINSLLSAGKVKREGTKRGANYSAVGSELISEI